MLKTLLFPAVGRSTRPRSADTFAVIDDARRARQTPDDALFVEEAPRVAVFAVVAVVAHHEQVTGRHDYRVSRVLVVAVANLRLVGGPSFNIAQNVEVVVRRFFDVRSLVEQLTVDVYALIGLNANMIARQTDHALNKRWFVRKEWQTGQSTHYSEWVVRQIFAAHFNRRRIKDENVAAVRPFYQGDRILSRPTGGR